MNISIKHIGSGKRGSPAKAILMTIENWGDILSTDITNLQGRVDDNLIQSLRQIADELQEQNDLIDNKNTEQ